MSYNTLLPFVLSISILTFNNAQARTLCHATDVPAGKEAYAGDVPIAGEACFQVVFKDTKLPARAHYRGVINGEPIDLDRHTGRRCLKFTRPGVEYRVYVISEEGRDLLVDRCVNE
jgi:hypothetical protein